MPQSSYLLAHSGMVQIRRQGRIDLSMFRVLVPGFRPKVDEHVSRPWAGALAWLLTVTLN